MNGDSRITLADIEAAAAGRGSKKNRALVDGAREHEHIAKGLANVVWNTDGSAQAEFGDRGDLDAYVAGLLSGRIAPPKGAS